MIEVGTAVKASEGFMGRVLGRHGSVGAGGAFEYRSLPEDLNVAVYAVLNDETGEVRFFTSAALVAQSS
jgi:hypothetical protein